MKPQNERLLKYLKQGYKVNPELAKQTLAIARLAARIDDIKHLVNIQRDWIKVKNKFGETCRVKQYWLEVGK